MAEGLHYMLMLVHNYDEDNTERDTTVLRIDEMVSYCVCTIAYDNHNVHIVEFRIWRDGRRN